MSKTWCRPAAAVIAVTASVTGAPAAPQATDHRADVAQVVATRTNAPPAAPTPAQGKPSSTGSVDKPATIPPGSVPAAHTPLGESLKDLIANRLDRAITRSRDRDDVREFYRDTGYAPLWLANGAPNTRAKAVIAVMRAADADGLDPASYAIPDFVAARTDPKKLAAAELALTDAVLTYARHAQAGRFGAQRVTVELEVTQTLPDARDVLQKMAQASNAAAALNGYNPQHPGYRALKAKLAELNGRSGTTARITIPDGPSLKSGMTDARVPLLRRRLDVAGDKSSTRYDEAVVAAVRAFQRDADLHPDGVVGPRSLAALNGASPANKRDAIVANMERWRWLPRDLGASYVMVNIPDFTLQVVNRGKTVWSTRIVVGKPNTPTPLLSSAFDNVLLNPTWHVPESIIYNEYLPALQRDPRFLDRLGLVLGRSKDGRPVVKQPPGEANALGRIKFNFSNRFHVYLHDTPTKHLFARGRRAYSHGCVRVQNPAKFGEVLLSLANPDDNYTEDRLRQRWGKDEAWLKLRRKLPVHLVYMSAYVDDGGKLVVREDIYGLDKRITAILKGDERPVASYAPRPPKRTAIGAEKRRELERLVSNRPSSEASFAEPFFPFFGRPPSHTADERPDRPDDFFDRLFR